MNMNTATQPKVFSPTILVLALLALAVTWIGLSGMQIPVLSNVLVDVILVVILAMAVCALGGIGRVAAEKAWSHPLSIVGYILGGAILLVLLTIFTTWKIPFITNDRQILLAVVVLSAVKMVVSLVHSRLKQN